MESKPTAVMSISLIPHPLLLYWLTLTSLVDVCGNEHQSCGFSTQTTSMCPPRDAWPCAHWAQTALLPPSMVLAVKWKIQWKVSVLPLVKNRPLKKTQ